MLRLNLPFTSAADEVGARQGTLTPEEALAEIVSELRAIRRLLRAGKPRNSVITHHKVDVVAGIDQVQVVNVSGTHFLCDTATARFKLQFDDGEKFPVSAGLAIALPAGFSKVTLFNESALDLLTVEFYASTSLLSFTGLIV